MHVNTGHATVAYTGALLGYKTIDEAMERATLVLAQLKAVLGETWKILWLQNEDIDAATHASYIDKIIQRSK